MAKKRFNGAKLNLAYLADRGENTMRAGYAKPKWISFCETMIKEGFMVKFYEANKTVSKYITVIKPNSHLKPFKVRFSDHAPIRSREENKDCDFFVGRTNFTVSTTSDAIMAVFEHFGDLK